MKFSYNAINGQLMEACFDDLEVVLEGPIPCGAGWQIDRINLVRSTGIYLEFRSGPENPPGFVESGAWEIDRTAALDKINLFAANKSFKADA